MWVPWNQSNGFDSRTETSQTVLALVPNIKEPISSVPVSVLVPKIKLETRTRTGTGTGTGNLL